MGELSYDKDRDQYQFVYDSKYTKSPKAIPIGPDLSLFKKSQWSEKGKIFPSFTDRIPSRSNPAYEEYCRSQGISVSERNPIVLLGTIGRRGPSSFVFEPVVINDFTFTDIIRFRKVTGLSRHEMAMAFDLNEPTLQRVETGKSADLNTMKRIQIYLEFPEVALWQLESAGRKISNETLARLTDYFQNARRSQRAN
ncbi:MAG: HipA N-terminal domain-containing protein [Bdellovibrionaceae bacterium]|nr:HipA N-terminal domain-containing protein [Pseudobdellovibrionaceae bacterium]